MCQCRICLDEVPQEERYQFCNCIGSNGNVHFECLEKWIRGNNYKDKCEICNSKYRLKFIPQYPGIINIDFMVLILLNLGSIIGCIYVWLFFKNEDEQDLLIFYTKNTLLYLPFVLTHILRIKYIKTKKVISYKLELIEPDENTPFIEDGNSEQNNDIGINNDGSINLSSDLQEDAQPLVVD